MADSGTFAPDRPSLQAATPEPSSFAAIEALPSIGTEPAIRGSSTADIDSASSSLVVTASSMAAACPLAVGRLRQAVRTPLPFAVAWPGAAGSGSTKCSRWLGRVVLGGRPSSLASDRCSFEPFLTLSDIDRLSSYFVYLKTLFILLH